MGVGEITWKVGWMWTDAVADRVTGCSAPNGRLVSAQTGTCKKV